MKKLFLSTLVFVGLSTAALACSVGVSPAVAGPCAGGIVTHDSYRMGPGISGVAWKNSVQRMAVYNGSEFVPGLIVRSHGIPTKYAIGDLGLSRDEIFDPAAAQAWAIALTGNQEIKPIGRTAEVERVYQVPCGPDKVNTVHTTSW